jgi:3-deoxy-D-manno-octulosonate 8-phosphate phosphatase (KDO 8-P phosphatase)
MTDGSIYAGPDGGKLFKAFGPDDNDAIKAAQRLGLTVALVSADSSGIEITQARADHMEVPLFLADPDERLGLMSSMTVYIGDGFYDGPVLRQAGFGIAPVDAWPGAIKAADAVTSRPGGHRAVAQAIDFTLRRLTR